jgi:hypothetical protein
VQGSAFLAHLALCVYGIAIALLIAGDDFYTEFCISIDYKNFLTAKIKNKCIQKTKKKSITGGLNPSKLHGNTATYH